MGPLPLSMLGTSCTRRLRLLELAGLHRSGSRKAAEAALWFSETSQNQPISVRRHDCQELPPSTCTLDHHGQTSLSMFMYHYEHVVIGPVNHAYAWRATADKLCPTMVLRPHLPAPNRGSRKVVAGWEWFAEPPNNKLGPLGKGW